MVKDNTIKVLKTIMIIVLNTHEFAIMKKGINRYLNFIDICGDRFNRGLGIFLIYMLPFLLELFVLIVLTIGLIKSMKVRREKRERVLLFLNCILCQIGFYVDPFIAVGIVSLIGTIMFVAAEIDAIRSGETSFFDSREATSQVRACSHLATAVRVTYPAAL